MMAGEPESLHTHEPLPERIERHNYDRLLMLSDGVFAIAITLLALELKVPERWDGSMSGLVEGTGRGLIGYSLAFFLVGAFWFAHRRLFAKIEKVDGIVTLLNILVLGLIGLAPFVARLIAERGPSHAVPVYLILIGTIFLCLAAIYGCAKRGLLHPDITAKRWRREVIGLASGGAVILIGGVLSATAFVRASPVSILFVAIVAAIIGRVTRRQAEQS